MLCRIMVLVVGRYGPTLPAPPPLLPPLLPAIGVGNLIEVASDDPAPGALVVGSNVSSTNHERPAGVAECFQRSEDGVSSPSSEIRAVFKSEPTRAAFSDEADRIEVEAAALAFDAFALGVGAADVLARRASDDGVGKAVTVPNKSIC